jgi:hypothetical protein
VAISGAASRLVLHAFITIAYQPFYSLLEFIMSSYEGRMGAAAQGPEPNPIQRQDSVQHAVQVADPNELRRAYLLYGTAGQALRTGKERTGA